jgi:hypothetical protein
MEVRAFGLVMQGLIQNISNSGSSVKSDGVHSSCSSAAGASAVVQQLHALVETCLAELPAARPSFADLQKQLDGLQH